MTIYGVQVNHLNNPVGIDGSKVRISWKVKDCKKQTAFQVLVKNAAGQVIEDSEKINSADMYYILKEKLAYRGVYTVAVIAFDEAEKECESPIEKSIITGPAKSDWKAKWINPELATDPKVIARGAYLIKKFEVKAEQLNQTAYLYATAHGLMNIYINGKEASDHQLMPGTQQYDKRLMVETLDVTDCLKAGENEMIVTLGNGWYRGSMGNDENKNIYGTDIAFLGQLMVGDEILLKTDESWQATSEGPLGVNDFMEGEDFDATKKLDGLHEVKIESFGYDNLICVDTVPVLAHEIFSAKWIETPNGEKVLDFGQNIAGYVSFKFDQGIAEKKMTLTHGEVLDKDGNFTTKNCQNARLLERRFQQVNYICKDGVNEYHPTKTYMGFRYIKVEADFEVQPEWFTAVMIYSDMDVTAKFNCGVSEVNQLFTNAIWSMKANFIDVPTDCPTREKSGFSGDCQAYVYTAMYLMDCYSVYAKWEREAAAGQLKSGVIPQISPRLSAPQTEQKMAGVLSMEGGIGWSDAFEIVPYKLAKRYGDDQLIKENYEALKAWTEYEIKRARKTRLSNHKILPKQYRKYMIDEGWMWGEWLEPGQDDTNYMKDLVMKGDPEVGTAFFYLHLDYMKQMAEYLGKTEDASDYAELAKKVKEAYRAVYTENGKIIEEKRQCRYVRPIVHDLLSEEEKAEAAKALADMITANGNHLGTGFLTTHELCRVLSDYGQVEKAYDLLLQKEMPGFLYSVTKGCTTIPEQWNCFDEEGNPLASFNHYSYGAITGWLLDSACGIRINDGKITIEPKPDQRLGFAEAEYESPYGLIKSAWKYEGDKCSFKIEIPANASAQVTLPGAEPVELTTGEYTF